METIFKIAKEFREALEDTPPLALRTTLGCSSFPYACCDDASLLLAAYFSDKVYPGSMRVHGAWGGKAKEIRSHVWLVLSGLIVDITADQFSGYELPAVFVSKESVFHKTFDIDDQEPADFRIKFKNDGEWLGNFSSDYKAVLNSLAPNKAFKLTRFTRWDWRSASPLISR